jgi:3-oxoacyl-[acyl-carrier protein] reductase
MSKSALQGLVQGLSRDLDPREITINIVQPEPIATETNPPEGEFAEMLKKYTALLRYSTVEEVAGMVAYLASPEAGYITGASLTIDGGFSA